MKIVKKFLISSLIATAIYAMPPQAKENAKDVVTTHSGVATKIIKTAGYSYINIEENGKKFWIAVAGGEFKKGQKITFIEEMWMPDFKSKTLDRTFDKILFASVVNKATSPLKKPKIETIKKLKDGYRVSDLYSKKSDLKDKIVKVRGKVVKVSENIMGKSWIHIQDGSGKGENSDVIFTSKKETPKVGDVVVASGKLRVDKDFGYGYRYAVIVEESTFSK